MTLTLEDVTVRYASRNAIDGVSFEIRDRERLSVLGPSGSGKSTMLRAIAGLEPLAAGSIRWDGHDLADVPVHRRGFGLMFQDYVLFPHLDVAGNVGFGLTTAGEQRAQIATRVTEVLALVGLNGFAKRLPAQLSGGEQQRVALARALAPRPKLLMLDEPLGALDRALRRSLLDELSDVFVRLALPIVYVTHDHEEAFAIGDRVAVMRAGRLEAVLPPRDLWQRPPTEFVARFLGFDNIIDAVVSDGVATTPLGLVELNQPAPSGRHRLLIRPDALRPDASGGIEVVVASTRFRGDVTLLRVTPTSADEPATALTLDVLADWSPLPDVGETLRLRLDPSGVVLLPLP